MPSHSLTKASNRNCSAFTTKASKLMTMAKKTISSNKMTVLKLEKTEKNPNFRQIAI